ncbi:hypothetical protein [Paracoccus salipaludis]|uniref:Uncharacterized protein n=1 Tax=Paracoccus salipaludis TaxID=2032623 RepID=A0A2A2GJ50_9RHOB|nr:hypothetical protein [Paracoccus salipaludis]PAU96933.1 hypothetical protein CK240_10535 [Paracoccus salipaludis]
MRHLLILVMLAAVPARAATPTPDWPCVQPRQSHLSLGQVWTGPPPPEGAAETPEIAALAERVVQRRMPIEEATAAIDAFAQGKDAETLALLMQAIFHRIDMQRTAILGGISRYGHRQVALAARVEARRARMAELEAADPPDFDAIDAEEEALDWDMRVFSDRQQSLTYVCETPVILEQRLFALGRALAAHLTQ